MRVSERERAIIDSTAAASGALLDGAAEGRPESLAGQVGGDRFGAAGSRAAGGGARDGAAAPPGRGAAPPLPSPPAVLCVMAAFWQARLAELERAAGAETRPDLLLPLAIERMCVRGILAGLDDR